MPTTSTPDIIFTLGCSKNHTFTATADQAREIVGRKMCFEVNPAQPRCGKIMFVKAVRGRARIK